MIRILVNGSVAYRIDGDRILEGSSGYDVAYRIDGDRILEGSSGYDVAYRIDGNRILKGSSGYDVAFQLDSSSKRTSSFGSTTSSKREKPRGFLGWLGFFLAFLLSTRFGRIGVIIGVVFAVLQIPFGGDMPAGNYIIFGLFAIFFCGIVGKIIDFILSKIKS